METSIRNVGVAYQLANAFLANLNVNELYKILCDIDLEADPMVSLWIKKSVSFVAYEFT